MIPDYFERLADESRGAGFLNRPPITLTDGRRVDGTIQPAPACYATPTADGTEAEFWPRVSDPYPDKPHDYVEAVDAFADDVPARIVRHTVTWRDLSVEAAASRTQARIDGRWREALELGIPHSVDLNGSTVHALLRYLEVDRLVWGTHSYGMPAPASGLLVALAEPISAPGYPFDGREQFSIAGQARLDAAKLSIRDHVNDASHAWEIGSDDVAAIVAGTKTPEPPGGWTDEAKVAALAGYDVEALDWPENTVPGP